MSFSVAPSSNTLQYLYKRILKVTLRGRLILSQFPLVGPLVVRNPTRAWNATHILIVCLSKFNGRYEDLQGPKADFILLLKLIGYCHGVNSRDFTLIHDFDATFTDANNVRRNMPKTLSSRAHIRSAIIRIMRLINPYSKVFFYFGGHGDIMRPAASMARESPGMEVSTAEDHTCRQAIVAGDGETISGAELRSWLSSTRHPSVVVTTVFDACHSGGSLGLRYTYEPAEGGIQLRDNSDHHDVHLQMLQISACRAEQRAFSRRKSDGVLHGELTWALARYLEKTDNLSIEGLVDYLRKNVHAQTPQVCCSGPLTGKIALF